MQANDEAITTTAPNPRSAKRIGPGMRSCTLHFVFDDVQHLQRLAAERSTPLEPLHYGDLMRTAVREYVERNPLGSRSSSSPPALPPTPVEQLAERNSAGALERFVARGAATTKAIAELEDAGFYVHARVKAGRDVSLCGLVGVGEAALADDDLGAVTCRNCRAKLDANDAAMRAAASSTSRAPKRAKSRASRKGAKKGGRR